MPNHVAIILDGNRRFAKKLMQAPWMGHVWGKGKVEKLLQWCKELGIKELTLYSFSVQNFNRPKEEFDHLMKIFKDTFQDALMDDRMKDICVKFVGRISMFPSDVYDAMKSLEEMTKNNGPYKLNICMAYGGREEITDAVVAIACDIDSGVLKSSQVNEDVIEKHLMLSSAPDMVVRTGGEKRTSNFLPWQCIYSEWFFLEKTWPEFEKDDLVACIEEFGSRQRRFGV